MSKIRSVKGMNDLLPSEIGRWHRLETTFRETVERHGFGEVRTPIVEPTALFVRSIGEATDIVEKEMYTFEDKADKSLTLRPEGTASAVRAYLEHSVQNSEPVSKWYYLGPMYRRERPAKGRYRQFYQAGCEVYGDPGPYVDAELIDLVVTYLRALGIDELEVQINSLGSGDTRERYRESLLAYLRPLASKLSEDSQRRLERNPLRVLDSKAPEDQALAAEAPSLLDHLDADDRAHFEDLKATLDAFGTPYRVEPKLVRGLDYYTRTLFEVKGLGGDLGAQNTLCGGGRYDGMIRELGGPDTPAIGFAMGLERLLLCLPEADAQPKLDVFLIVQKPELRLESARLARELREAGLRVDADLRGTSMKSQLRRADRSGARFAVVVGEAELAAGKVQLKDLHASTQEDVARDGLVARIAG
ncbi:MAG: histidine--tRNA ligase [Sandaracinus sp.]|nr:histidine--tRNA ligase [Sandaracinus sp.]